MLRSTPTAKATILFHPVGEGGHVGPTLALARQLRARGDRVVYLTEAAMGSRLDDEGFEHEVYLEDQYPAEHTFDGSHAAFADKDRAMWAELTSGRLAKQIEAIAPDVILHDVIRFETALAARQLGIPCIRVSTSFPTRFSPPIPRLFSDALPNELSTDELLREWNYFASSFCREPYVAERLVSSPEFQDTLAKSGVELEQVMLGMMGHFIDGDPELVCSSPLLDYPFIEPEPNQVYFGSSVPDFDGAKADVPNRRPSAPLVYCAFGGQGENYPRVPGILSTLLIVCDELPHIDFVLAAPEKLLGQRQIPANVTRLDWAPQRALLSEADVFLSHCGQGSYQEAVWHGVPILACPQAYDQHGNAARIAHHGLGLRILEDTPSAADLREHIETMLSDPGYRARCSKLSAAFRAEAKTCTVLDFVDSVASGRIPMSSQSQAKAQANALSIRMYARSNVSK